MKIEFWMKIFVLQNEVLFYIEICVDFKQPTDGLYQSLLKAGVIVRPVANYGMPNHLRVSIGTEPENLRFINELAKIVTTQKC